MTLSIAIAVVEHEDRFLVGQRPAGVALAGLWEFPGGKVREGETPAEAAVRECLEETGLTIVVVGEYSSHKHEYDHGPVHLHFFACRLETPNPTPHPPFRWIDRAELAKLEFPDGNRVLIDLLLH